MIWSSLLFPDAGSSLSSENSVKQTTKGAPDVMDTLKCYVCGGYFIKPRILPCGHSFCEKCVASVRDSAMHEFNKARDRNAHRRGDSGFFTCPWPNCHYSMRLMNVSRWTTKNRALAKAVTEAKRHEKERQTVETQTEIDSSRVIISLPMKLFSPPGHSPIRNGFVPASPTATVVRNMLQNIVTTEIVDVKHCQPPNDNPDGTNSWRSYAYAIGMTFLDQVLKTM